MVNSYKSFFNPANMLVVAALLALILFRHSLFPEAIESTEVKQLMGKVDEVIDDLQKDDKQAKLDVEPELEQTTQSPVQIPEVAEQEKTEEIVTEEVQQAVIPESAAIVADDNAQEALRVWQTARRAAWDGNSDAAVENYRALIKLQPDNYDAYGEMGNVLLQKGDTAAAVDAYAQAALLLAKSGYPQAAWHVINIVARLDQNRAKQLQQSFYGQPLPSTP